MTHCTTTQGRQETAGALERSMRTGPRGFGGVAPKKFIHCDFLLRQEIYCDYALKSPGKRGKAPFMTDYYKKLLKHSV